MSLSSDLPDVKVQDRTADFRAGAYACAPTILGYWSIGFAAGAIGALAGFSTLDITLMAGLLYAGSAQFLFYSLYAAGADQLTLVVGVLLMNLRYFLMSSYISVYLREYGWLQKFLSGALLTDETFGVASQHAQQHGKLPFAWLLGLNLTAYLNWILANLAGAVLASALPASLVHGLGFSLTAMFVGLLLLTFFASRMKRLELTVIGAALVIAIASSQHLDANLNVLLATVAAALLGALLLRKTQGAESPS